MRYIYLLLLSWNISLSAMADPVVAAQEKDPFSYPLKYYIFVVAIALVGGLASWITKVRAGTYPLWSVTQLVGELIISAFAGVIVFWLCAWQDLNPFLAAALTGIGGHAGTKTIAWIEAMAAKRVYKTLGIKDE